MHLEVIALPRGLVAAVYLLFLRLYVDQAAFGFKASLSIKRTHFHTFLIRLMVCTTGKRGHKLYSVSKDPSLWAERMRRTNFTVASAILRSSHKDIAPRQMPKRRALLNVSN